MKPGQMTLVSSSTDTGKSKLCVLRPNNARLKQLIKEHGNIWVVKHGPNPMQCFGDAQGFGIESLNGDHFRNVKSDDIHEWP